MRLNSAMLQAVSTIERVRQEGTLAGLPPCVSDSQGCVMSDGKETRTTQDRMMTLQSQDRNVNSVTKQVHGKRLVQEGVAGEEAAGRAEVLEQRVWCD